MRSRVFFIFVLERLFHYIQKAVNKKLIGFYPSVEKTKHLDEDKWIKTLTFSSQLRSPCFDVVNIKRTAVTNRKLRQITYEAGCHARHIANLCLPHPSAVLLRKVSNKIGRLRSGISICVITSIITDEIG